MRTLTAAAALALCVACLPGKGENQSCVQTQDCQSRMVCLGAACLAGQVADAGQLCKFECAGDGSCPNGEVCVDSQNPCAHCEPPGTPGFDGG